MKYTVKQVISHKLIITYADEFEVNDQNKWNELKDQLLQYHEKEDLEHIPNKAPSNPQAWLDLYSMFPDQQFGEHDSERLVSGETGDYEYWCELYDEDNNQIE